MVFCSSFQYLKTSLPSRQQHCKGRKSGADRELEGSKLGGTSGMRVQVADALVSGRGPCEFAGAHT